MRHVTTGQAWALAACVAIAACGDPMEPKEPDLTGTWDATSAIVTNPARPSQSEDLIAIGLEIQLVVKSDGSVTANITQDGVVDVEAGSITLSGNEVSLLLDGELLQGTYSLVGQTLTLDLRSGFEWDFEGDGLDVPVTLLVTLVRTS